MHGLIFAELKKYVEDRHGKETWRALLKEAGLGAKIYMPIAEYPDVEAVAIVGAASRATGTPAGEILEDFGEFIAPDLMQMYRSHLDPQWRTLEFLENTEETIHKVVRRQNPGARPPEIRAVRTGPREVVVHYASERRMCGVAKGIIRAAARHFGDRVTVSEPRCMLRGHPSCEIAVRLA